MSDQNNGRSFGKPVEYLGNASFATVAWVGLYQANDYLFTSAELNSYVNLVFLPAALRVLAVLLAGYAGAVGLFLGALITNQALIGINLLHALALSALSAIGPVVAVWLSLRWIGVSSELTGLKWWHLFVFATIGALCNVIPKHTYLWAVGEMESFYDHFGSMLFGDLLGTSIVLLLASFIAKLAAKIRG